MQILVLLVGIVFAVVVSRDERLDAEIVIIKMIILVNNAVLFAQFLVVNDHIGRIKAREIERLARRAHDNHVVCDLL